MGEQLAEADLRDTGTERESLGDVRADDVVDTDARITQDAHSRECSEGLAAARNRDWRVQREGQIAVVRHPRPPASSTYLDLAELRDRERISDACVPQFGVETIRKPTRVQTTGRLATYSLSWVNRHRRSP